MPTRHVATKLNSYVAEVTRVALLKFGDDALNYLRVPGTISEYPTFEVIHEMHRISSKVPCIYWILILEAQFFLSISLCNQPFSRHKVVENRKCIEWPQNDLGHWTVNSTLYTIHWILNPEAQHAQYFMRFTLQPDVLEIQGCRKSEIHWVTSGWPCTLNCQKYPGYTEYLTPEAQIFIRLTLRPAFFEI